MSGLDPFGGPLSGQMGGYGTPKTRSKVGGGSGLWQSVEGTARDVGTALSSQFMGKGSRGWDGINGILSLIDMLFGVIFLLFSVKMGDAVLFATAISVGALSRAVARCLQAAQLMLYCNTATHIAIIHLLRVSA
jgi:hypothetical protein